MLALVVAGLSTGHKIGLAVVGGAFIVFALVSSFVLPRRNPNFPGRFIGLYITICGAVLRRDARRGADLRQGEAEAAGAGRTTTTTAAQTTPARPRPRPRRRRRATRPPARRSSRAPAARAATRSRTPGSTGNVGPNLDQLKPAEARIVSTRWRTAAARCRRSRAALREADPGRRGVRLHRDALVLENGP